MLQKISGFRNAFWGRTPTHGHTRLSVMSLEPVALPEGALSPGWVCSFADTLVKASWLGHQSLQTVLSASTAIALLERLARLLAALPPLIQVSPQEGDTVTVVGDTHGQLHDIMAMFKLAGLPGERAHFIFNGDYVDRGSWGLEVLLIFGAWRLALPSTVTMLRGNHETTLCTMGYGFQSELKAKYGDKQAAAIYKAAEAVFIALPLAARIAGTTLVLHGGLFRPTNTGKKSRKRPRCLTAGSLSDLENPVFKPSADPSGTGLTRTSGDILWSDPVATPGLRENKFRGVGLVFGPDITEAFLAANNLRLIIRSHEGPDARHEIEDPAMNMKQGYTCDHTTRNGNLMTVFSAPDYPQHQSCPEEERYRNLAAVAVLRGPSWADPEMLQYAASLPRPQSSCFYDILTPGSDEEAEVANQAEPSEAGTDAEAGSGASDIEVDTDQLAASSAPGELPPLPAPEDAAPDGRRRSTRARKSLSSAGPLPLRKPRAQPSAPAAVLSQPPATPADVAQPDLPVDPPAAPTTAAKQPVTRPIMTNELQAPPPAPLPSDDGPQAAAASPPRDPASHEGPGQLRTGAEPQAASGRDVDMLEGSTEQSAAAAAAARASLAAAGDVGTRHQPGHLRPEDTAACVGDAATEQPMPVISSPAPHPLAADAETPAAPGLSLPHVNQGNGRSTDGAPQPKAVPHALAHAAEQDTEAVANEMSTEGRAVQKQPTVADRQQAASAQPNGNHPREPRSKLKAAAAAAGRALPPWK